MPNDVVQLVLQNDKIYDTYGNPAYISGTFDVTYGTNVSPNSIAAGIVSGSYSIRYSATTPSGSYAITENKSFSGQALFNAGTDQNGNPAYSISDSQVNSLFTINYAGQQPTSLASITAYIEDSAGGGISLSSSNAQGAQSEPVTATPLCFCSGTFIRTDRGDVSIEDLVVGDKAVTVSGALQPVRWIGRRNLECSKPITICAGAFGAGRPRRDLRLSPGHPVLVGEGADGEEGYLVPIMCLVNGTSVVWECAKQVVYWHVELATHDILLAEGLPVESYLEMGDRVFFTEESDDPLHNPDNSPGNITQRCRPVAMDGPAVDNERRRLDSIFASLVTAPCVWPTDHHVI